MKKVKIIVFVPLTHCDRVRRAIGDAGGGIIGNYSCCSFSSKGVGRFKPNNKAKPFIGKSNALKEVDEEKIEFVCPKTKTKEIINEIKKVHPYEEVALDIYELLNEGDLK